MLQGGVGGINFEEGGCSTPLDRGLSSLRSTILWHPTLPYKQGFLIQPLPRTVLQDLTSKMCICPSKDQRIRPTAEPEGHKESLED